MLGETVQMSPSLRCVYTVRMINPARCELVGYSRLEGYSLTYGHKKTLLFEGTLLQLSASNRLMSSKVSSPVSFFERRIFICILTVIALSTILENRLYSTGFPKLCYAYQFSYMSLEVLVCEDYSKIVNNNFSKNLLHNTYLIRNA